MPSLADQLPFTGPLCAALAHAGRLAAPATPVLHLPGGFPLDGLPVRLEPAGPDSDDLIVRQGSVRLGYVTLPGLAARLAAERPRPPQVLPRWMYTKTLP